MSTYALGSNDAETARLDAQAELLREQTQVLLEASGIGPGMRVLDLGTGLGHVAFAIADLVGPEGEVVGLDNDPRMVAQAQARAAEMPHVHFVEGDVTKWRDEEPFDALVGRLILFHLPDPLAALRHHLAAVRPGGRVLTIDYDMGGMRAEPPDPVSGPMIELMRAAFRAAGADPTIGSRLQRMLVEAGVEDVGGMAVVQYLDHDNPVGPMMLSSVVRSLAPVMVAHGLATEAELDLDTLATRAAESLRSTNSVLVPPLLAGAWGRRDRGTSDG